MVAPEEAKPKNNDLKNHYDTIWSVLDLEGSAETSGDLSKTVREKYTRMKKQEKEEMKESEKERVLRNSEQNTLNRKDSDYEQFNGQEQLQEKVSIINVLTE